jgi:hypothetical protein
VNYVEAALDTCAGCNLIRANQLPEGCKVESLESTPSITAAQGQKLDVIGQARLKFQLSGSFEWSTVDFLVVEKLVVPVLVGTPWIDENVVSIDPMRRVVRISLGHTKPVFETPLCVRKASFCVPVRVAIARAVPAFSEAWVEAVTDLSGRVSLFPDRRRDHLVQVKNAVLELSASCRRFKCLVANFGEKPVWLRKG